MIETIPQKKIESTKNKQGSLKQTFKTNIDTTVDEGDTTRHCVQWLNLHQPETLSKNSGLIEIAKTSYFEEVDDVDTNNNSISTIIDIGVFNKNVPPEKCDCNIFEKDINEKIFLADQEAQTDFSIEEKNKFHVPENVSIVQQTSSNDSEVYDNLKSQSHLSRPLLIRPILKYTSEYSLREYSSGSNSEDTNRHQHSTSSGKSSSVSFLLPSESQSTGEDTMDGKFRSRSQGSIDAIPKKNNLEDPPGDVTDFKHKECLQNLPISPNDISLRMSRPSSFSDSDISGDENASKNILPIKKIDEMMKGPLNIERGGRYSILNKDFSSKNTEKSVYTKEIETIRKEIICHQEKYKIEIQNSFQPCEVSKNESAAILNIDNSGYSSGESTDTLLEEARNYVQMAKEKIVTLDDWKIIEENKKKYRKR